MKKLKIWSDFGALRIALLLLLTSQVFANEAGEWIEKKKSITFSYSVSASDKVSVDNQFGDVKVSFWDKNEVKVDVSIIANAVSEERAANYISTVDVVGKKVDGGVSIKTIIDREDCNYNSNVGKNGEKNTLRVDYQVFVPRNNPLRIKNSFGNTHLPNCNSFVTIDQNYGTLFAENIKNAQADVDVSFGKAILKEMDGGKLKVSYSTLTADRIDNVMLNNSFGKVDIKELGKIDAKISYSSGMIQNLKESSKFKLEFSSGLKFGNVSKGVRELDINASYSPISLTLDSDVSYDFDVRSHYGSCDLPEERGLTFVKNSDDEDKEERKNGQYGFNPTKVYSGKIGKGTPTCKIVVNGNFSSVKLK